MKKFQSSIAFLILISIQASGQNHDPLKMEIVTTDLKNFWEAFEKGKPTFDPDIFQKLYFDKGSKGLQSFITSRIKSSKRLADAVAYYPAYFNELKSSTDSIEFFKDEIRQSMVKFKALYPKAIFPPVYFVIGVLSSGGTSSDAGLIIGSEMYGLTVKTNMDQFDTWLKTVLKPVGQISHIVAHEVVHFQQSYDGGTLLQASLKEGSADFISELISGSHINQHVHAFADPRERELWDEFKERMNAKDYKGWLYSSTDGRPNDLGYWIGYKITKAYYDSMNDKKKAIADIINIKSAEKFLVQSKYTDKFAERNSN